MGSTNGTVHLFERSEEGREMYRRTKTFKIQQHPTARVINIAVSPTEESLVCSLDSSQFMMLSLSGSDLMKVRALCASKTQQQKI